MMMTMMLMVTMILDEDDGEDDAGENPLAVQLVQDNHPPPLPAGGK